jgi:hypothetical protein
MHTILDRQHKSLIPVIQKSLEEGTAELGFL